MANHKVYSVVERYQNIIFFDLPFDPINAKAKKTI